MTRTGGPKEVMRGINGGIKRLIKLLTMKYYYHCFINSPKVHIPHTPPTFGSRPRPVHTARKMDKRKKKPHGEPARSDTVVTIDLSTPSKASRLLSSDNLSFKDIENSPQVFHAGGCFSLTDLRGTGTGGADPGRGVTGKSVSSGIRVKTTNCIVRFVGMSSYIT